VILETEPGRCNSRSAAAFARLLTDLGWQVETAPSGAHGTRLDVVVRAL